MAENKKLLMYKGKPLVRKDNTLYYGYMDEPCIIMMQITSTKNVNGAELSDKYSCSSSAQTKIFVRETGFSRKRSAEVCTAR